MGLFKRAKKQDDDAGTDDEKRSPSNSNTTNEPTEDDFAKATPSLSEAQIKILKDQIGYPNDSKATIFAVYRYAGALDLAMIAVSAICSIAAGVIAPLMILIFGQLAGDLSGDVAAGGSIGGNIASNQRILYLVYLAIASFGLEWIATAGWQQSGRRIARRTREEYLRALLRQNIGFFDSFGAGKMTSSITSDMNAIQEAISEKVGLTLSTIATFVGSFIVGFIQYWALALILSSALPAMIILMGTISVPMQSTGKKAGEGASEAATVIDEAFSAIKSVMALNMQERMKDRYATHTRRVEHWSSKTKTYAGLMLAVMMCVVNWMYSLAFWQGNRFKSSGRVDIAAIIITLLAIMTGSFSIAMMAPNAQAFNAGTTSAAVIFRTIDRPSPMDSSMSEGLDASQIQGEIVFKDVRHVYPSRVTTNALLDYNLRCVRGKSTALVGPSGGGKSTVVGLLQRFYTPVAGSITIDGVPIAQYNLGSLRRQIAVVSQEPVLFSLSLRDNIALGLSDDQRSSFSEAQLTDAVKQATMQAYAHEFIIRLPQGYDTDVGERGVLLSGGQRQRIAIARALISDPKILLFDEATSALDTQAERIVQRAIEEASRHRTTIMIAHRLSTIRDADSIAVVLGGQVCEQGTHSELLARDGAYKKLVNAQALSQEADQDDQDPDLEKVPTAEVEVVGTDLSGAPSLTKTHSKGESILRRTSTSKPTPDGKKDHTLTRDAKADKKYSW
jgi:ATP-binding cassette subfamily B (MDR/TAP) protein 1